MKWHTKPKRREFLITYAAPHGILGECYVTVRTGGLTRADLETARSDAKATFSNADVVITGIYELDVTR